MMIFGHKEMTVYHSGFIGSELGQDVGGGFFGFVVWTVGMVVVPYGPRAEEVGKVFLET